MAHVDKFDNRVGKVILNIFHDALAVYLRGNTSTGELALRTPDCNRLTAARSLFNTVGPLENCIFLSGSGSNGILLKFTGAFYLF